MNYSSENADSYRVLGIKGTSWEPSYMEAKRMLGKLKNKNVLDFGCGTGRSSRFLEKLGAKKVVGVDNNKTMLITAVIEGPRSIEYHLIKRKLPFLDDSFDYAFASQVFMEMRSLRKMKNSMKEIARVLNPGGRFILVVTNPEAWGHNFISYSYLKNPTNLKSGDQVECVIKGKKPFSIINYFWTENDYKKCLWSSGFIIEEIKYPRPKFGQWLAEKKIAPDMVIKARKNKL